MVEKIKEKINALEKSEIELSAHLNAVIGAKEAMKQLLKEVEETVDVGAEHD